MNKRAYCPRYLLLMHKKTGRYLVQPVPCGASRKCAQCAQRRAQLVSRAIARLAEQYDLKVVFATATFKPSLGVTVSEAPLRRNAILQAFRRAASSAGMPLIYASVIERHKSGVPHIHFLFAWTTVRAVRAILRHATHGSHCHAKWVRGGDVATYLAKYVAKQQLSSITASRVVSRAIATPKTTPKYILIDVKPSRADLRQWLHLVWRVYGATFDIFSDV